MVEDLIDFLQVYKIEMEFKGLDFDHSFDAEGKLKEGKLRSMIDVVFAIAGITIHTIPSLPLFHIAEVSD